VNASVRFLPDGPFCVTALKEEASLKENNISEKDKEWMDRHIEESKKLYGDDFGEDLDFYPELKITSRISNIPDKPQLRNVS
jgi:hypothetical protein